MKVELLKDCPGPNPLYDAGEAREAEQRGEDYEHEPDRIVPAGTVIETPTCWRLCLPQAGNAPPLAKPVDAAAKRMVAKKMERFQQRLRQLQLAINAVPKTKDGKPKPRNRSEATLIDTAAAYGLTPA